MSYDYQTIRGGALTYVEQPTRPTEEVLVIELQREATHKLGLSIVGGTDNPSLKSVHVRPQNYLIETMCIQFYNYTSVCTGQAGFS